MRFDIIPSGSRDETYKDFVRGVRSHPNSFVIVLVDSEDAVTAKSALEFLQASTTWAFRDVRDAQCHLMVQVMESWFLADMEALVKYYGPKLQRATLPNNPNVEQVAKSDVLGGLTGATKHTRKGRYHKTKHAAALLSAVSPEKVIRAAPFCKNLFSVISGVITETETKP